MTNSAPFPPATETTPDPITAVLPRPEAFPGSIPGSAPDFARTGPKRPAFFRADTWRAFAFHWVTLLLAPFGLAYAVSTVSLGASLLVTVVGLVATAAMVAAARYWGTVHRGLTAALLDVQVPAPPAFAARPGFFGYLRSGLTDSAGWRALAHMGLSFAASLTAALTSITVLVSGLGCMTHWYWSRFLPAEQAADGTWHRGSTFAPDVYVEGLWWQLAYVAVGVLLTLAVWPALNNSLARLQAKLAAALLGPTQGQLRVRELEDSRSSSVQDADARLQRIERDLHDGTQAQLVSIAMKLGDAKERLAAQDAPAELVRLIDSAHGTAKDALVDLRGLARGIRPAVLNDGLDTALESLAATAPIPVSLTYQLAARPSPAVEAIAYYCAAELLNNAVKHSGASRVHLRVGAEDAGRTLRLLVRDDGSGGADPAAGTGLAGLGDRVRTVDGTLRISSPAGGPTEVTLDLPLA